MTANDDDAIDPAAEADSADGGVGEAGLAADPFTGPSWRDQNDVPVPAGEAPPRRRRRRVSRRRLRRRRRAGLVMLLAGGVIVLGGIWLLVTGLLARSQLESVRSEVHQLHQQIATGNLDGARATARQIADHAHRAHEYTQGPAWAVAAAVPGGGAPFGTVRTITAQTDVLGQQVLPRVITATRTLDPSSLRRSNGSIDLTRISSVAPTLQTADAVMTRATGTIAGRPSSTWLGFVDRARSDLLTQLDSLQKTLHSADLAARIAPPMLGEHGTRRYFVAFQNDAEARGTGGLPGAFAIVQANHGKLRFERFESDNTLERTGSGLDFGRQYQDNWGASKPTEQYLDSNVSAHYPYAAQIWMAMWRRYSGQRLDGAIAVDPTALSYLLRVTGPARLPDGELVTAGNVVRVTQQTVYARYASRTLAGPRKEFLLRVAKAVSEKVLNSKASTTALVKAAGHAGVQRRLLIYSSHRSDESGLEQTSLSGVVPDIAGPYSGLVINNAAGNKLDYYLGRRLTWQRTGCGTTRQVTVTIALHNGAPADVPAYASERNDHPSFPTKRGDNREAVFYYATKGAVLTSLTVDGAKRTYYGGSEQGHPLYGLEVEIPRGTTRTVVLHLLEPAGQGAPLVLRQPLVQPMHVRVLDQSCG